MVFQVLFLPSPRSEMRMPSRRGDKAWFFRFYFFPVFPVRLLKKCPSGTTYRDLTLHNVPDNVASRDFLSSLPVLPVVDREANFLRALR